MRGLRLLAALSLLLPGFALSPSPGKGEVGLLAKGPIPVLKEDRGGGVAPPLWGNVSRPTPPRAPRPRGNPFPAVRKALPQPGLYLLYRKLQLEGG
ncbi:MULTISPECIES: hypothetical protein [Thermus]|jgi:hypothetical protein|uniref:Uncharacterized protein n=1 Tax=Thermus brockianus TaxID=56956 RepID=A0A1J0LR00_THEBO|nr:hypothetical protein [Thermus brockianus]APD08482.1 hypothetical protein A0O31_00262 [Thermus brockianus]BDG16168.1 hypothetical protein TbrSNM41_09020 [Thermus brockianus]